jgi:spore maturation protein CgeB
MRIFVAVRHARDPKQFYGGLWSANFYPALRALGHELVESEVDLAATSRFMDVPGDFTPQELEMRARTTDAIVQELEAALARGPVDLFLSYFYNAHFDAAAFDRVRALGVPSINFYCNSIHQFANVAEIAAKVDVAWHAERDARDSYLAAGANPVWVQMAADPNVYYPIDAERRPVACFIGQNYADRAQWMASLVEAGVPVKIYGPGWGGPDAAQATVPVEPESEYLGRKQHIPGSAGGYAKAVRDVYAREGLIGGTRQIAQRLKHRRMQGDQLALFAPHAKGPVPFDRQLDIFGRTEVCLNFSNVWVGGSGAGLIPHVRLRDFEAPMCRTTYLTGHTDEITEFYDVGSEIDTYRTAAELIDKTRFYLRNPDAAERLREAGYRRAVGNHTWVHRFRELFSKANLAGH